MQRTIFHWSCWCCATFLAIKPDFYYIENRTHPDQRETDYSSLTCKLDFLTLMKRSSDSTVSCARRVTIIIKQANKICGPILLLQFIAFTFFFRTRICWENIFSPATVIQKCFIEKHRDNEKSLEDRRKTLFYFSEWKTKLVWRHIYTNPGISKKHFWSHREVWRDVLWNHCSAKSDGAQMSRIMTNDLRSYHLLQPKPSSENFSDSGFGFFLQKKARTTSRSHLRKVLIFLPLPKRSAVGRASWRQVGTGSTNSSRHL